MPREPIIPFHTSLDTDNRLTLPKHICDEIPWLTEPNLRAWLFLLSLGRYRLLSDEQVQNDPNLDCVRSLILEGKTAITSQPTHSENPENESIVARLIPITFVQYKQSQSWRFLFSKELTALAPDCDIKKVSILLSLEGYWEIWYTDLLKKTLSVPLHEQPTDQFRAR